MTIDPALLAAITAVLAASLTRVADRIMGNKPRDEVRRQLLNDEGENGDATIKKMIRESHVMISGIESDVNALKYEVGALKFRIGKVEERTKQVVEQTAQKGEE